MCFEYHVCSKTEISNGIIKEEVSSGWVEPEDEGSKTENKKHNSLSVKAPKLKQISLTEHLKQSPLVSLLDMSAFSIVVTCWGSLKMGHLHRNVAQMRKTLAWWGQNSMEAEAGSQTFAEKGPHRDSGSPYKGSEDLLACHQNFLPPKSGPFCSDAFSSSWQNPNCYNYHWNSSRNSEINKKIHTNLELTC